LREKTPHTRGVFSRQQPCDLSTNSLPNLFFFVKFKLEVAAGDQNLDEGTLCQTNTSRGGKHGKRKSKSKSKTSRKKNVAGQKEIGQEEDVGVKSVTEKGGGMELRFNI
jgi:hypothetical protein